MNPSEIEALLLSLSVATRSVLFSLPFALGIAWLLTRRRFLGHTLLDALVQLSVLNLNLTAPPASPADGDRHIVAAAATGLWAGWDLNIATWVDGAWLRLVPRVGWLAHVAAEGLFRVWTGTV